MPRVILDLHNASWRAALSTGLVGAMIQVRLQYITAMILTVSAWKFYHVFHSMGDQAFQKIVNDYQVPANLLCTSVFATGVSHLEEGPAIGILNS
jgi:hypothetical protein